MKKVIILLICFVDISIACMELSISAWSNEQYDTVRTCPMYNEFICLTPACCELAQNYYACTKALARCAQVGDEKMFEHWWAYHAAVRNTNLSTLLKRDNVTVNDRMEVYSKYCHKPKNIRKIIFKETKNALGRQDLYTAKTLFVGSNLNVFELIKEYYKPLKYSYDTTEITYLVLQKGCQLNDLSLVHALCGGVIAREWIQCIMAHSTSYLISELIASGALDINRRGWAEKTLLHYAAEYNLSDIINILLEKGVDVNCIDAKKMTPLHYAAKKRHVESIRALLENNEVDIFLVNKRGKTALDYVTYTGWQVGDERDERCIIIKGLLEKYGEINFIHREDAQISIDGYYRV